MGAMRLDASHGTPHCQLVGSFGGDGPLADPTAPVAATVAAVTASRPAEASAATVVACIQPTHISSSRLACAAHGVASAAEVATRAPTMAAIDK